MVYFLDPHHSRPCTIVPPVVAYHEASVRALWQGHDAGEQDKLQRLWTILALHDGSRAGAVCKARVCKVQVTVCGYGHVLARKEHSGSRPCRPCTQDKGQTAEPAYPDPQSRQSHGQK